jgi:hypothetical protein
MVTLDDKLLGEKLQNYCSSSDEDNDSDDGDGKRGKSTTKFTADVDLQPPSSSNGSTGNVID